ncbi:hypothetical protein [Bacillus glycinifermentans]|uniref:hypothetical protein n=1 Tax=Bacillus glycinifermentans TaxID=1664069 RepID=UPI0022DFD1B7|nr:hypothetical protein [Bacillus glycinifermentans]
MNTKELRDYMINISNNGIGDTARKAAQSVFKKADKTNEDNLIITSAIAKKAFIDAFDLEYERLFLMAELEENIFE